MTTTRTDLNMLFATINNELDLVKDSVKSQLKTGNSLPEPFTEFLNSQNGKMIRPGLVLLSGKAIAPKTTAIHIKIAAIVEMLHNATLLHDDVLDKAQCRRGRTTANKLWGNELAVLLGDLLLSKVLSGCVQLSQPQIVAIIAETTTKMCTGEIIQNIQRLNFELTETEYIDIITAKTAVFFSTCCRLGALASEADEDESQMLAKFGLNAGIAFQINDDLLDITGAELRTGKTLGTDLDKNNLTLPIIHLLNNLNSKQRIKLIEELRNNCISVAELATLMQSSDSFVYTQKKIQLYCQKAVNALEPLKETPAKTALIELAQILIHQAL